MRMKYAGFPHGFGRAMVIAMLLSLAFVPVARAHARLVRSEPAKDAELAQAPGRIEMWFNELLDEGFNTVRVFSATETGTEKHADFLPEKPVVDPKDRTHLSVKLPALAAGEYVVEWRVLSRDGHSAPGRFTFRVVVK